MRSLRKSLTGRWIDHKQKGIIPEAYDHESEIFSQYKMSYISKKNLKIRCHKNRLLLFNLMALAKSARRFLESFKIFELP